MSKSFMVTATVNVEIEKVIELVIHSETPEKAAGMFHESIINNTKLFMHNSFVKKIDLNSLEVRGLEPLENENA